MADCSFEGRAALVTGGGSGLGRQYAIDLARRGARVMVNNRPRPDGEPSKAALLVEELRNEGLSVVLDESDVAVESQARGAVEHAVSQFGRIDLLVNNAGGSARGRSTDTPTEMLRSALDVHLFGMFWTMQQALGHMRNQDYGRIVNTGSGVGAFGCEGSFSYVTAKSALIGMAKATALENQDKNIRVNNISPIAYTSLSSFFAEIHPRFTEAHLNVSKVSPAVLYLLSEGCRLNGETLHAAGGRVARIVVGVTAGYSSPALTCEELVDHLDEVMDKAVVHDLKNSWEQYPLIP